MPLFEPKETTGYGALPAFLGQFDEVLLIDADIVAYRFASLNETKTDWGEGEIEVHGDVDKAILEASNFVHWMKNAMEADATILCFTEGDNFRKDVLPFYKGNRRDVAKPYGLREVRLALWNSFRSVVREGIEADDIMSYLATHPSLVDKSTICTLDKDLRQIPTWFYNWTDKKTTKVMPLEGEMMFWAQTLMGDTTDGYKGCHGIGKDKAYKLLDGCETINDAWPVIMSTYIRQKPKAEAHLERLASKRGTLTDEHKEELNDYNIAYYEWMLEDYFRYILSQARVARMYRYRELDDRTWEPVLWQPPMPTYNAASELLWHRLTGRITLEEIK